ncbi:benenodin family lasso peptide [Sphingobium lignivorans]|uniref:Benenodin family lasso peptide n=1 Tax=Sphingobium lignivorans TaxID=2735886 RepID=A0ABR6NH66_9SPHN|nr:benenodin family lasso peptide [Sphingobium lignivorans]MBB5986628.1 hypothetical protein [Sphingobium lignivorans]
MNYERETDDLIELGTASTDTKGGAFIVEDNEGSLSLQTGLTDD